MKEYEILPIYEENIVGLIYDNTHIQYIYKYEDVLIKFTFRYVYFFDFCECEYANEEDENWEFGLFEYNNSSLLQKMFSCVSLDKRKYAFGGGGDEIRHYRLRIDDVGVYNIVCKGVKIEKSVLEDDV